ASLRVAISVSSSVNRASIEFLRSSIIGPWYCAPWPGAGRADREHAVPQSTENGHPLDRSDLSTSNCAGAGGGVPKPCPRREVYRSASSDPSGCQGRLK